MGLAKANESVSFVWDSTGGVCVAVARRSGSGLSLLQAFRVGAEASNRWEGVSKAIQEHAPATADLIVLGGALPGAACLDFPFPALSGNDLKEALTYELPRFFPVEPSELEVGFRRVSSPCDEDASATTLRVFAARREAWEDFILSLSAGGIKFDAYIHPFMAVDPLLEGNSSIYLPAVEPDWILERAGSKRNPARPRGEGSTPEPLGIEEALEACGYDAPSALELLSERLEERDGGMASALLLAAFALSSEYRECASTLPAVPPDLKPERYRRARALTVTLAVACALLSLVILGRNLWEVWSAHSKLRAERVRVEKRTAALLSKNKELSRFDKEVVGKISEAASGGVHNPVFILQKLAGSLPEGMWIYKLSIKDRSMDINVRGAGGQGASELLAALNATGAFKTKSSYTKSWKGMESVYVSMTILSDGGGK